MKPQSFHCVHSNQAFGTRKRLLLSVSLGLACLLIPCGLRAQDLRVYPFANGECANTPDGELVTNAGWPFIHGGDSGCNVSKTAIPGEAHWGRGAFKVDVSTVARQFAFFSISMHGFGPDASYWQSRDLSLVRQIEFWMNNQTATAFTLKLELKDYRDDGGHIFYKRLAVPAGGGWQKYRVAIPTMNVRGTPDRSRMRFLAFAFEEFSGQSVSGPVFLDDVNFRENGSSISASAAGDAVVTNVLARRMTIGLWGSQDRDHGLVPLNSAYADLSAINSTAGLIALLPTAVERRWLARGDTDAYVEKVLTTLTSLMLDRTYLLPRYVESRTLEPDGNEESSVDTAIMALSLVKYRTWLAGRNPGLAQRISTLLNKFNFKPFFENGKGFHHAFLINSQTFTPGFYDSYSTEVHLLALTAQIAGSERVPIARSWNAGVHRVRLGSGRDWFVTAETEEYRSPFMQFLLNLFVKTSDRGADNFPVASLRRNPWANARKYQQFVTMELASASRGLQPDAGIDLAGTYGSYSLWRGPSRLSMPWSATFVHLADQSIGLDAFRNSLKKGHHSLFGFSEAVERGTPVARADLWNVSLSALALTALRPGGNRVLSGDPVIDGHLDKVFPQPSGAEMMGRLLTGDPIEAASELAASVVDPVQSLLDDAIDEMARLQLGEF